MATLQVWALNWQKDQRVGKELKKNNWIDVREWGEKSGANGGNSMKRDGNAFSPFVSCPADQGVIIESTRAFASKFVAQSDFVSLGSGT